MDLSTVMAEQHRLQQAMGWPCGHGTDAYRLNLLAFGVELGEATQELNWKPWKDAPADREALGTELVDALQFWANAVLDLHGVAAPEADDLRRGPLPVRETPAAELADRTTQRLVALRLQSLVGQADRLGTHVATGEQPLGRVATPHRSLLAGWGNAASLLGFGEAELAGYLREKWEVNHARLRT